MINFPVSDWMPDAKIPSGPIQDKWSKYKLESKLIKIGRASCRERV